MRTCKDSSSVLCIHAKAVVADAWLAGEQVFVGSENLEPGTPPGDETGTSARQRAAAA